MRLTHYSEIFRNLMEKIGLFPGFFLIQSARFPRRKSQLWRNFDAR
eukprot:SAG22_NODE_7478_length_735_cov_2.385220_2_plen_45_part_01